MHERLRVDHFEAMVANIVGYFAGVPVNDWGRPGCGKSAMNRTAQSYIQWQAQQMSDEIYDDFKTFGLIDNRLSQQEGIDIRGLFKIITDENGDEFTSTIRPVWLPTRGAGMIVHDEFNMGEESAKKAVMQLLTDWMVGTHILPRSWGQVGNGNLARHKGLGKKMTPAEENRWCHIWMDDGDSDDDRDDPHVIDDIADMMSGRCAQSFTRLALNNFTLQEGDIPIDITKVVDWTPDIMDGRVTAYFDARPHLVNTFDPERNKREDYGFSSNRTIQYLSKVLQTTERFGKECYDLVFRTMAHGLVGPGVGEDFVCTLDLLDKLIDLDAVKHNGKSAPLPIDDPTYKISVTFVAMSALATAGHFNRATGGHIIDYVRRLHQISPEIPPVFVKHLEANSRKHKGVEDAICDPSVGYMKLKEDYLITI